MTKKNLPAPPRPAAPTPPTYTWESLLRAVPAPTAEQSALYAPTVSPADLIASGARIRSDKILTDLVRFSGLVAEFLPTATDAQRRLLLGFSDSFFRVTVHEGDKLRGMAGLRGVSLDEREAKRTENTDAASQLYTEGLDERQRLVTALGGLTPYDSTLQGRLDAARDRVVDAKTLAASLRRLVKLVRQLLADETSVLARQLVDGGMTEHELEAAEKLAKDVETRGAQASGARAQGPVTQAQLDQQDGVCLVHLERLMKIFNVAHGRDPSIPQLTPLATRQILAPTRKRPVADPVPVADPAATAAGGTKGK